VLADMPARGSSADGHQRARFAAQFARGPKGSRFYLQCAPEDTVGDWPPDRIHGQLRARLGRADLRRSHHRH